MTHNPLPALRAHLKALMAAFQATTVIGTRSDDRSLQPRPDDADAEASQQWQAKVFAARRTEALAADLVPQLPEGLRPYLRRLVMRDAYPSSLQQLVDLSCAHRSSLDRLFLHGCAPTDEYEEAKTVGPAFEEALVRLMVAKNAD